MFPVFLVLLGIRFLYGNFMRFFVDRSARLSKYLVVPNTRPNCLSQRLRSLVALPGCHNVINFVGLTSIPAPPKVGEQLDQRTQWTFSFSELFVSIALTIFMVTHPGLHVCSCLIPSPFSQTYRVPVTQSDFLPLLMLNVSFGAPIYPKHWIQRNALPELLFYFLACLTTHQLVFYRMTALLVTYAMMAASIYQRAKIVQEEYQLQLNLMSARQPRHYLLLLLSLSLPFFFSFSFSSPRLHKALQKDTGSTGRHMSVHRNNRGRNPAPTLSALLQRGAPLLLLCWHMGNGNDSNRRAHA